MRHPTRAEWEAACAAGFESNGSTFSADTIYGVKIANGDNRWPPLPADLHDFRYFCGGTELDRRNADQEFLDGLYARVDCLEEKSPIKWEAARRRCRAYHETVRLIGSTFWAKRERPEALEDET